MILSSCHFYHLAKYISNWVSQQKQDRQNRETVIEA